MQTPIRNTIDWIESMVWLASWPTSSITVAPISRNITTMS
jgi:hypothetical protein